MSNPALDQTTLEESFFFCEYAKRRFEMSDHNNGHIEDAIKYIKFTSKQFFESDIAEGMQIDLLSDAIFCHEARMIGLRYITPFEGSEGYIEEISFQHYTENLLHISNSFKVSASFLPFPYDMAEIAVWTKSGKEVPATFKTLDSIDRRCVIALHRNRDYVLFCIDKNLQLDEIIDAITKQATLLKSVNDYENCKRNDKLKQIHMKSNLKTHRQSLHNTFYKSSGLLIYDLYISNNFKIDRALEEYRKRNSLEKCDPAKKATSEDCAGCKYFSECESNWRKHFKSAVEKISGTEGSESYLNRIRDKAQVRLLKRQPISFFEYQFSAHFHQNS